jgi:hypothetical protein
LAPGLKQTGSTGSLVTNLRLFSKSLSYPLVYISYNISRNFLDEETVRTDGMRQAPNGLALLKRAVDPSFSTPT